MNDESKKFNCCVQCKIFWDCKTRLDSLARGVKIRCCSSCGNFELCKIVNEKIKEEFQSPAL
ncbi:MAG: hypothetical protein PHX64_04060 [Candidatus Omnitrophica bacterium]|nr:hypothetical protein [Candidatus Omnitrophota bacterium]MDD5546654.1 hypothetical protein [Candidatus Omnitrophota bacterium]